MKIKDQVKNGWIILAILISLCRTGAAQILDVPIIPQQNSEWCWAACSKMVMDYYGSPPYSQCSIAEYARTATPALLNPFGSVPCCNTGTPCNSGNYMYLPLYNAGTISGILQNLGGIQTDHSCSPPSLSEIRTEISAGRPIIIEWQSTQNSSFRHFIVCCGVVNNLIFYIDPLHTESLQYHDYNWMKNGTLYSNLGVETHSWHGTLKMLNPVNRQCPDNFESNNDGNTSWMVFGSPVTGQVNYPMTGNIGYAGDEDWFKIDMNTPGFLLTKLTNLPNPYEIFLYSDMAGNNLLSHDGDFLNPDGETVTAINNSAGLTSYYARVKAINNSDSWTGSCYNIRFIYVPNSTCTITGVVPNPVTPGTSNSPGETIVTLTPTLTWNAVSGATSYEVYVQDMSNGTFVVTDACATSGTNYTVPSGRLTNGGSYKWYILAVNSCGSGCVSNSSVPLYFNVQVPVSCSLDVIAPTLVSPGTSSFPGQLIQSNTPTLSWNAVPGATNYGVYIRDMNSNLLVYQNDCATSNTNFPVPNGILTNGGQYRWNIIATNACGSNCTSYFSDHIYFQVEVNLSNYEYWFDDVYSNKVTGTTPLATDFSFNQLISTGALQTGLHSFHIRFADNNGIWSSVVSQFFYKLPVTNDPDKLLTGYEYWIDNNYGGVVSQPISNQQQFILSPTINLSTQSDGLHSVHIRFKDNANSWSSVLSQFFYKTPSTPDPNKLITQYEYWFDTNYSGAVSQNIAPTSVHHFAANVNGLPLTDGLHSFHFRYKDNSASWSSVISHFFYKIGNNNTSIPNLISSYRYWFDTTNATAVNVLLPTSVNPEYLNTVVSASAIPVGAHRIHFQFKDVAGYWSSVTNDTFLNQLGPHAAFIANDTTLCYSGTVTFSNLSMNASSYQWTFGDGGSSVATSPTHTYAAPGLYSVSLVATNAQNLHDTLIKQSYIRVTVPNVTVSPNTSICPGSSAILTASGASNYLWYPTTGLSANNVISVTASPSINTTYQVVGTDQYGCVDTAQVIVTVSSNVTVSISPSAATICSGDTAILTASGADTYVWSPSMGLNNTTGVTVSANPNTTITYIVIGTSTCGSDTESIIVTVNQTPIANAGNDTSICAGATVDLLAHGGNTYSWSNGPTTALNIVTPGSPALYIVTVTSYNCSASDTVSVAVNPLPVIDFNDTSICIGSTILLDAGNPGATYVWQDAATSQTHSVSSGGTYSVTVTNSFGCIKTDSALVNVSSTLNVQINDTSICQGQLVILNAGFTGSTYQWSTNATSQSITVNTGNIYTVTVTHPSGCTGTDAAVVTIFSSPQADAGTDVSICFGDQTSLVGTGGINFDWSNGVTTSVNNVSPSSTTVYYLTVTDNHGCLASDSVKVVVNQLPAVSFDTISEVCSDAGLLTLTGGHPVGGIYSGTSVSNGNFNPVLAGVGSHILTYTYTDNNGCHDSAQTMITVNNCTGIQTHIENANITVFPNPTSDLINIAIKDAGVVSVTIKITNALGQEINSDTYVLSGLFRTKYDMSLLANGIYFFKVMVKDKAPRVFDVVLAR